MSMGLLLRAVFVAIMISSSGAVASAQYTWTNLTPTGNNIQSPVSFTANVSWQAGTTAVTSLACTISYTLPAGQSQPAITGSTITTTFPQGSNTASISGSVTYANPGLPSNVPYTATFTAYGSNGQVLDTTTSSGKTLK